MNNKKYIDNDFTYKGVTLNKNIVNKCEHITCQKCLKKTHKKNITQKWNVIGEKDKLLKTFSNVKSVKYKYKNKWFLKHISQDNKYTKYITNSFSNKLIECLSPKQIQHILQFSQNYSQQGNQTFCATAAIIIILNIINRNGKLMFTNPYLMDNTYLPYPIITQKSLYNVISQTEAMGTYKGLSLEDVMIIYQTLGIHAEIIRPQTNIFNKKIIQMIYNKVNQKNTYILVNYGCAWKDTDKKKVCSKGRQEAFQFVDNRDAIFWNKKKFPYRLIPRGGHFVPMATAVKYNNKYWFLLVEVANFKYNWFWIDEEGLYDTITTIDNDTKKYRGIIIIRE